MTPEIEKFLESWKEDKLNLKPAFIEYLQYLNGDSAIELDFKARPNISYSLRAKKADQKKRDLFVLVDVIDDEPESRWLSVCFYADMISDPDGEGDFVPEGLLGEDALCFNLDEDNARSRKYILARLIEAAQAASANA